MKRFGMLLAVLLAAMSMTACNKVPAGHVGIKVYLLGSEKGVDHEVLPVGRHWIGINEELYLFPTFEQNPKYTADQREDSGEEIDFQTKDGMRASADFSVTYEIQRDNAAKVFQRYRRQIQEINEGPLRNIVRDAINEVASALSVEEVYGSGKVKMLKDIETLVTQRAAESGLTVKQVSLLGAVRLPKSVMAAIEAKNEATQKAMTRENELREAEAQAAKEVAAAEGQALVEKKRAEGEAAAILTRAEAQAKANRILAASLTSELVQYETVQKWNGQMPQVAGSQAANFITLGK